LTLIDGNNVAKAKRIRAPAYSRALIMLQTILLRLGERGDWAGIVRVRGQRSTGYKARPCPSPEPSVQRTAVVLRLEGGPSIEDQRQRHRQLM